ncbi:MAG: glycosyltransferase family 4 protein [Beijerinckiaceae bacterium]|nr:glycosyltransferase family 4 protein [Beijerinckiaceae bacterium]
MKAFIDCSPLTVGGGVQVALGLLAGLQESRSVKWMAAAPEMMRAAMPPELASDERIHFVEKRSMLDRFSIARALAGLERAFEPQVVFTVFGPQMFRSRAPHLVGFAQPHMLYDPGETMPARTMMNRLADLARGIVFRRADFIVVETETARQRFAERVGFDLERIHVIPNAPNLLLRRVAEHPRDFGAPFTIFMPSAWYAHKNLEMAPLVAQLMRELSPGLDFRFRLTLPPDGEGWRQVAQKAAELGVSSHVETLGAVPITELPKAYDEASVVYLPTVREVSTAVYPESFYFRRPLVTSDMDFARDLCGDAAIFTPPRDARAAAERLLDLARWDDLRRRVVAAGDEQLARAYPTPAQKLEMQLALLEKVASSESRRRTI